MDIVRQDISVVVPVKDRFELALAVIRTILEQTALPREIIVIDDGSTEPFEAHLAALSGMATGCGVDIRVARNANAKGVSTARNLGVSMSCGSIVCLCDSDDFWSRDKLQKIASIFQQHPGMRALCHAYRWKGGTLRHFSVLPQGTLFRLPRWLIVSFSILNPSCFCFRRGCYAGGFREDLRHHEDLEYFIRFSRTHRIWFLNEQLTEMARPPGSAGGASHDGIAMREGAVTALEQCRSFTLLGLLASLKIRYHRLMLRRDKAHD